MPDSDARRKPLNRLWLFAPSAAAIAIILAWSAAWLGLSATVAGRLDAAAGRLRAQGWTVDWTRRVIGGYPFQIKVELDQPIVAEPSGWGVSAPRLDAEANAYDLGHWVLAAPMSGVTLNRPQAGAVAVDSELLRASVVTTDESTPRILLEAAKFSITPLRGAKPLPIAGAQHLQFGLRPAPGDQGQVFLQIDGATATPGGALALVAGGRPLDMGARGWVSRASAFAGRDWPAAVRAWAAAGGQVNLDQAQITGGSVTATVRQGVLKVADDGRLDGSLSVDLSGGVQVLRSLGQARLIDPVAADTAASVIAARGAGASAAKVDIGFQAGVTTLGPVAVAPAPKVY